MAGRVIHISEAEAASHFTDLLARVREGVEVVIERGKLPIAIIRPAEPQGRLLSDSFRLAKEHGQELNREATLDPDFAADLEEIINSRKPREISSWE
jgi:antitoxin (DNA-binding transcriptional repressor) of toxin-antitoxin stability system